ncbi:MAG: flagellar hook assembly protein FlgD [Bosea sp.]|jgi:flagellar basal-body rod modification protein FlgD|nr:flagellar hook assembly protein FlgD [Bosea sp. (in: a-proteobacteria)]
MTTVAAAQSAASSAAATATATSSKSRAQIAGNFNQFLNLLTTQLKNQNPLEPLDTNQFTQQLVQFAQVEQQLQQNETLTSLLSMSRSTTTANAMGFVGNRVTMDGSTSGLKDGSAQWRLDSPKGGSATITIKNKAGSVVATEKMTLNAGTQNFTWNGRTSTGGTATDGDYTIVVDALDAQNSRMSVKSEVTGIVDSVDFTGETPVLVIGSARIPLDKVKSVNRQ